MSESAVEKVRSSKFEVRFVRSNNQSNERRPLTTDHRPRPTKRPTDHCYLPTPRRQTTTRDKSTQTKPQTRPQPKPHLTRKVRTAAGNTVLCRRPPRHVCASHVRRAGRSTRPSLLAECRSEKCGCRVLVNSAILQGGQTKHCSRH